MGDAGAAEKEGAGSAGTGRGGGKRAGGSSGGGEIGSGANACSLLRVVVVAGAVGCPQVAPPPAAGTGIEIDRAASAADRDDIADPRGFAVGRPPPLAPPPPPPSLPFSPSFPSCLFWGAGEDTAGDAAELAGRGWGGVSPPVWRDSERGDCAGGGGVDRAGG